jgi:hypothetical protein
MKIVLIFLPLFLFCFSWNEKNDDVREKKTDVEKDGLNGKVKQVTLNCFYVNEKSGEIIKEKKCDDNNYSVVYDVKGKKIELTVHSSGWRNEKRVFKYNTKGTLSELHLFDADNNLLSKFIDNCDENGNKIESNLYDTDNNLINRQTYKYDDKGNEIEHNEYNSKNILILKHIYKYDVEGNQIESSAYTPVGNFENKNINKYDDKRNRIETNSYNAEGIIESKGTWKYDEKNNPIEENWYNQQGILNSKYIYNYVYDQKGNWLKKMEFEKDIPKRIIIKEIMYFP